VQKLNALIFSIWLRSLARHLPAFLGKTTLFVNYPSAMDVEQKEALDEPALRQPPPSSHSKQDISVVPSGSTKESPKTILSYAAMTRNLLKNLKSDIMAADVKWSLFVSAANDYKFDSCLKPFPSQFVEDEEKDIESLVIIR
jgi:ARTD15 N-terminal domain